MIAPLADRGRARAQTMHFIGLDWGTSALRAYGYGADGQVLQQRQSAQGLAQVMAAGEQGFFQALDDVVGDWVRASAHAPLLACGMVGSAQGWREAAYRPIPTDVGQLARYCTSVPLSAWGGAYVGRQLHILPGLIAPGALEDGQDVRLPNVMRGEETQIVGALQARAAPQALYIVLPGTHCKWVRMCGQQVQHFDTFMTGEVFAALCQHTILGRTMRPAEQSANNSGPVWDEGAFGRGVRVAASAAGEVGVLGTLFSTRALGLTGALPAQQQGDYLSGLLIGYEVQAMVRRWDAQPAVWLVGEQALCQRYAWALRWHGVGDVVWLEQATAMGLWHLGRTLGAADQE